MKVTSCNPEVYYHIIQTSGVEQNDRHLPIHSFSWQLLIIRPIAALIWVVRSRHLALGRRALHTWWWGASRSGPHPRAEPSRLAERGTEGALVFRKLLHGVGVVVMGWRGIDRGTTVLWWRSWGRVVHIGRHLAHDVPWRWSDGRGGCGHGGRRGLVVHHVWCPRALRRMLHGVANRRRWRRWRAEVLLRWCHHVVGVRHYGWLAGIFPGVVVGWLSRAWPTRVGLPRGRGVILDRHGDEIAVFASCYRGDAECLRGWGRGFVNGGRGRLAVGVVTAVLERVGEVNMVLG